MADPRPPFAVPTPITVPRAPDMVPTGRFLPPDPVNINPISGQPVQPSTVGQPPMGVADFLAGLTPGVNTAYNWNRTGPWGRAANIGLDLADALTLKATGPITTPLRGWLRNIPRNIPNVTSIRTGAPRGTSQELLNFAKVSLPPRDLPVPIGGFDPSRNWGAGAGTLLPKYQFEKGISGYQALPVDEDMIRKYQWGLRSPDVHAKLDPSSLSKIKYVIRDPKELDKFLLGPPKNPMPGFDDIEPGLKTFKQMEQEASPPRFSFPLRYGDIDTPLSPRYFGNDYRFGALDRPNLGLFKLEGKPLNWLGSDYEMLLDPKAVSSWGKIDPSTIAFADPDISAQLFKNFDPYGNPLPWVDRFGRDLQNFIPLPQGQSLPFTSGARLGQVGSQYINELQR